ncbi:MAG: CAP domain-containing protein [Pseudomonadota bacterium]
MKLALPAILCAVVLSGCASDFDGVGGQPAFYRNLESPTAVLDLNDAQQTISQYRSANGLGQLVLDPELVTIAQNHANAQARRGRMSHNAGGSLGSRLKTLSEPRGAAVENVGAGYRSFAQAFSGWRNSKGHNENMLNTKVTRMGIAKAVNPNTKFKVFWTLILTSEPI